MIEAEWTVTEGLVHGDSIVSASLFYTKEHAGDLDVFIADQAGWDQFVAGSPFQAFTTAIDDPGRTTEFIPPEPVDYYVAWSNKASMDMAHVVRGAVRLYCNTGAVPPVANLAVSKDASAASLLDWEDLVGHNVSGYSVYRSINPADVAETKTDAELAPFLLATRAGHCTLRCARLRAAASAVGA